MLEELRILLHLLFLVNVIAYDRPTVHRNKGGNDKSPYFERTPENYTFEAGEMALLKCEVKHLGKKRVGWRRASQPNPLTIGTMTFVEDDRITVEHPPSTNQWNLMIKRVRVEDAGVYECQVASKARHLRKHVLLTVKERKVAETKDNIQITGEEFVSKGETIFLVCNATGKDHSPEDLDWFKNGNKLSTMFARKISIRKFVSLTTKTIVSVLEIKDSKMRDTGVYVCRTSDLQITSKRINVLNAERSNTKRESETKGQVGENSGNQQHGSYVTSFLFTVFTILTIKCRLHDTVFR